MSSSLSLLRLIEEKALQENTEAIQAVLPLDMATYLLNEKRHEVNLLESRLASRIIIIPSDKLSSPQFQIKRLRADELEALTGVPSYRQPIDIAEAPEESLVASFKSATPETAHVQLEQIQRDVAAVGDASSAKARAKPAAKPRGKTAAKAVDTGGEKIGRTLLADMEKYHR